MANALGVCLFTILLCCTSLSSARQVPKECSEGPSYWCQNLNVASDCGAVGHCSATVWETSTTKVTPNEVSAKFLKLFRELKDVKEFVNEDYVAERMTSACHDVAYPAIGKICKQNSAGLEKYVQHVLKSKTSAETMCTIIGMCNNEKVDNILALNKKKSAPGKKNHMLGSHQCTWGPSYWCSNFSTSHECKANSVCVTRVWPQANFPEDNDSICKICTDMVKQARDQLQSNETQEELKEVFEGSCQLIPIKLVAKQCMKLADEFVPELVETLASEMNPQTVCSVAGLCNNADIDRMLVEYNARLELREGCNNCARTVGGLRKKFDATTYEDFLVGLLQACRKAGSLSDSCSMLVFKYYENILAAVKKDLTPSSVCHVSGQCSYKFHSHDEFVFPEVTEQAGDDVPCEFCEQLIKHLKDTMVANTTELEFYKVLQGLCKQTGNFKSECLHLAEEYYPVIYSFLTQQLKPAEICAEMGMCAGAKDEPIAPLLPKEIEIKAAKINNKRIGDDQPKLARVPLQKQANVRIMGQEAEYRDVAGVLPIERMFVPLPAAQPESKAVCSFCEYFLHYLQVELSDTNTIDKVTEAVDCACEKLPSAVNTECKQFVEQYGPAVVALLVQEIDPASVCPALGLCPKVEEVRKVSINVEKTNCPLCLFAVTQLRIMLNNTKSEEKIRKALDNLCTRLSPKLQTNCVDFVDSYTQQLVEMLAADLDANEICVYLKLCPNEVHNPAKPSIDKYHEKPHLRGDRNNFKGKSLLPASMLVKGGDIETNEIPDNTVGGRPVTPVKAPKTVCVICEFVLKEIDDQIKDKHNRDEIMAAVHGVCKHMPKSVRSECDQFVDKYGELVISLLAQDLEPSKVCEELKLCPPSGLMMTAVKEEILDCAVCETVVMAVKKVLSNDRVDRDIVHVIEKSCGMLPAKYSNRCHTMMEIYGTSVIHLIEEFGVKGVCQKIGLCSDSGTAYVHMYREKRN